MSLVQIAPGASPDDLRDFVQRQTEKANSPTFDQTEEKTTKEAQLAFYHSRARNLPESHLLEHITIKIKTSGDEIKLGKHACIHAEWCGTDIRVEIAAREAIFQVSQDLAMGLFLHEFGHAKSVLESQDRDSIRENIRKEETTADAYACQHGTAAELSALREFFQISKSAYDTTWDEVTTYLYGQVVSDSLNQAQKAFVLKATTKQMSHFKECTDAISKHPPYEDRIRMINEVAEERGLVLTHGVIDRRKYTKLVGRITPLSIDDLKEAVNIGVLHRFKKATEDALASAHPRFCIVYFGR